MDEGATESDVSDGFGALVRRSLEPTGFLFDIAGWDSIDVGQNARWRDDIWVVGHTVRYNEGAA